MVILIFVLLFILCGMAFELSARIMWGFNQLSRILDYTFEILYHIVFMFVWSICANIFGIQSTIILMLTWLSIIASITLIKHWLKCYIGIPYYTYPWETIPEDMPSRLCGPMPDFGYGEKAMFRVVTYDRAFGPTTYVYTLALNNMPIHFSNTKLHDVYYD